MVSREKKSLQLKGRASVFTLDYPLLAVLRDGHQCVGEVETRCGHDKPFNSNEPVNSIPDVCHYNTYCHRLYLCESLEDWVGFLP